MDDGVLIQVKDLAKTYNFGKVKALDGISLDIQKGEIFGLIGPNGAGKTTLMGCLLGLLWPSKGSVVIDGRSPNDLAVKSMTGFMPERPSFDKWMTITQFLTYQYMLCGKPLKTARPVIDDALVQVQLERAAWKRPIRKLSRGMLQRVGLAQIIINKPKLCFLDEPTSGMDPLGMALVRELLLKWRDEGATIVLNSHHLDEVERICNRVAFIQKGSIQSIENTGVNANGTCIYIVRWDAGSVNGTIESVMNQLTEKLEISLQEHVPGNAKLRLNNQAQASEVINFLVHNGIPITEATFERKALLDLFVEQKG
ncbi:MAG TPA: ABC transporter ATP-binding protein [Planktothrix sp.]|jgi:ABC-2 type transport system ATP-binding protein